MSPNPPAPEHELALAVFQRNSLARSLTLHPRRSQGPEAARSLRALSQATAALAAGLARRPAADGPGDFQHLLAEAARHVRERAAAQPGA